MSTLANRLRSARKAADLTQKELAELSGVTQQMISKLEAGRSKETTGIVSLADALGVSPLWLEKGRGPQVPPTAYNFKDAVADGAPVIGPYDVPDQNIRRHLNDLIAIARHKDTNKEKLDAALRLVVLLMKNEK